MKSVRIVTALLCLLCLVTSCAQTPSQTNESGADAQGTVNGESAIEEDDADTQEVRVYLTHDILTADPAAFENEGEAAIVSNLFSGLARWERDDNGARVVVPDLAVSLPEGVPNEDGTVTYTYTLKNCVWTDGIPVTAHDFVFSWNRVAAQKPASAHAHLFSCIDGFHTLWPPEGTPAAPDASLRIRAADDKTLEVVLSREVPYWNELLAHPAFRPVRTEDLSMEALFAGGSNLVSNGAYCLSSVEEGVIRMVRNEAYDGIDENGTDTVCVHYGMDEADLPAGDGDKRHVKPGAGTVYLVVNVNEERLVAGEELTPEETEEQRERLRLSFGSAIDRTAYVNEILQGGQIPATSLVAKGITDEDGITPFGDSSWKGNSSPDASKGITWEMLYPATQARNDLATAFEEQLSLTGVTFTLRGVEPASYQSVLENGDFMLTQGMWIFDVNDPIAFFEQWTTNAAGNLAGFGTGQHKDVARYAIDLTAYGFDDVVENGTWAETYDVLIARIRTCGDRHTRYALMHMAEDMLLQTGCLIPLYYTSEVYVTQGGAEDSFDIFRYLL